MFSNICELVDETVYELDDNRPYNPIKFACELLNIKMKTNQ